MAQLVVEYRFRSEVGCMTRLVVAGLGMVRVLGLVEEVEVVVGVLGLALELGLGMFVQPESDEPCLTVECLG